MKMRWISLLLGIALILSIMTPFVLGAETSGVPELQYVVREGQGSMEGITRLEHITERYLTFYRESSDTSGLMDLMGNILVEGKYSQIDHVRGDVFSLRALENDLYALYRGGKALTTHRFNYIYKGISLICGFYTDGRIEHFDLNGEACTVPEAPIISHTQSQIVDITHDNYLHVRYESGWTTDGDRPLFKYRVVRPDGEVIPYLSGRAPAVRVTEGLFAPGSTSFDYSVEYYNIEGEEVFHDYDIAGQLIVAPDKNTFILHYKVDGLSQYRVYDKWANPLFDIEAVNLDRATNLVINYIDNDKILYQKSDREYVVVNTKNEILRTIKGELIAMSYEPEEIGKPYTGKSTVPGIGFLMVDNNKCHFYRADMKADFYLPGFCRAYEKQKLLQVFYPDTSEAVYDLNGNELVHGEGTNSAFLLEGILAKIEGGNMILCTRDGEAIAERDYTLATSFGVEGIIRCKSEKRGGYYFVTQSGRELNAKAFREVSTYPGCKTAIYKNNEGFGLVRIYTGEGTRFMDIPEDAWYREGAEFCAQKGLFNGTEAGRFSPEDTMTRAMLVTVLWRLEGEPVAIGSSFADVPEGLWYSTAVQWAAENQIVNGVGHGRFDPDGNVTREQIATILCRYASMKGNDTDQTADLSAYADVSEISDYARKSMTWACAEGLINGMKSGGAMILKPRGNATRAQVATILMRYIQD